MFKLIIVRVGKPVANLISGAKVECDFATEKLFSNRIFNRKTKSSGTPLFTREKRKQKKYATKRPSTFNRISQSHFQFIAGYFSDRPTYSNTQSA